MTPNSRVFLTAVALPVFATLIATSPDASAQDRIEAKVEIKDVAIEAQKTPEFSVSNVTDKRTSKSREWLEFETEFEGELADRDQEFIDSLTFKYYMILNPKSRDEQRTLTGEVTYVNIPVKEKVFAVAYVAPATIQKITGNKGFSSSEVSFWGIEVIYGGQTVGMESSTGKEWWKSQKAPPSQGGLILTKRDTPFAPLWADYHVDAASSR